MKKRAFLRYTVGNMKFLPHIEKTSSLSVLFGLAFVVFGWFALSLTLGSVFLFPLIAFGFVLLMTLALVIAWKFLRLSPTDLRVVFVIAALYAISIGVVSEPTIFSGRDQGSIAEAAYRLAKNTELAFSTPGSDSFFQIYGAGTALNFPGFAYTSDSSLLTQFPLGYTAWLGSFVSLFDMSGFAIGNALLLFLFLFFFYQLLRLFVHPYYAFAGLALALTSFLPSWFAKLTLTENLAVFLFTFLVYNLILFFREGKFLFYTGILLSGGLLAFTRIEGFAILFLALALVIFHPHTRALIRTYPSKTIIIPGLLFSFILLRDFFMNLPYYKMIGKALLKTYERFGTVAGNLGESASVSLGSIFFLYGFLLIALLGLFGVLFFLKKKQYALLIPAFIALPTFLYLFQPSITPDHPWMLRRYLFTLFPVLVFSAVMCLALLFAKKEATPLFPVKQPEGKRLFLVTLIFLGLILLQYPAWSGQLWFAEHRGLTEQIATFSQEFSDQDLILVDRNATGDGFAMLTGPAQFLFGKNTVYFFNPYDLTALDTSRFEHVYLLTPEESQSRYAAVFGDRLVFKKSVTFTLEQYEVLSFTKDILRLPEKQIMTTKNSLFQIY